MFGKWPMLRAIMILLAASSLLAADKGQEAGFEDDVTIKGQAGIRADPDLEVQGYSAFGTNYTGATVVTSGVGNVYIQNSLELGSNVYVNGVIGIGVTNPASLLTVGTNLFQVNASGDIIRVKGVTYSWPGTQGGANSVLQNDGSGTLSWSQSQGGLPMVLTMHAATNAVWFNMPAASNDFMQLGDLRTKVDLSGITQARITLRTGSVAGAANSGVGAQYSTDESTWNYLDGKTGPWVNTGTASVTQVSQWVTVTNSAQQDVFLRLVGFGGNGTTDPRFGRITIQFK